jgi:hypothetical protein
MPFLLFFVGLLLLVAAVRGKTDDLFEVAKDDFTGAGNYFVWVLAVALIVAVGSIDKVKPISNAFLWLVVIVILISNRGLLPQFVREIEKGFGVNTGILDRNNVSGKVTEITGQILSRKIEA